MRLVLELLCERRGSWCQFLRTHHPIQRCMAMALLQHDLVDLCKVFSQLCGTKFILYDRSSPKYVHLGDQSTDNHHSSIVQAQCSLPFASTYAWCTSDVDMPTLNSIPTSRGPIKYHCATCNWKLPTSLAPLCSYITYFAIILAIVSGISILYRKTSE